MTAILCTPKLICAGQCASAGERKKDKRNTEYFQREQVPYYENDKTDEINLQSNHR